VPILDGLLVLTRKCGQSIVIGDDIEIRVVSVKGDIVRFGIDAPRHVPVFRTELYLEIKADRGEVTALTADEESLARSAL